MIPEFGVTAVAAWRGLLAGVPLRSAVREAGRPGVPCVGGRPLGQCRPGRARTRGGGAAGGGKAFCWRNGMRPAWWGAPIPSHRTRGPEWLRSDPASTTLHLRPQPGVARGLATPGKGPGVAVTQRSWPLGILRRKPSAIGRHRCLAYSRLSLAAPPWPRPARRALAPLRRNDLENGLR